MSGIPGALHASFRLPSFHGYADLVEALFQPLRTLRYHSTMSSGASKNVPVALQISAWDIHMLRPDTLLATSTGEAASSDLFTGQRRVGPDLGNDRRDVRHAMKLPGMPGTWAVSAPHNRCLTCCKEGWSTRTCPKSRDGERIDMNLQDCGKVKRVDRPARTVYLDDLDGIDLDPAELEDVLVVIAVTTRVEIPAVLAAKMSTGGT